MNIPQLKRMLWVMNEIVASTPNGGISREKLNSKWINSSQNDYDGNPIKDRTFYRIINNLEELFQCDILPSPSTQKYSVVIDRDDDEEKELTLLDILLKKNMNNTVGHLLNMILTGNDIPADDMRAARDLSAAVSRLPQTYSEEFLNNASVIQGINRAEPDEYYRNYICIWNDELYQKTRQWLSIGFYDNEVCFYLVTNEQDFIERSRKAEEAGFGEGIRYRGGYFWHKPLDPSLFTISFDTKPDMSEVIARAELIHKRLENVIRLK